MGEARLALRQPGRIPQMISEPVNVGAVHG